MKASVSTVLAKIVGLFFRLHIILFLVMKYALLTKREVKMAGYWPSSCLAKFFFCDEVKVHKNAKKRTRTMSSHLQQTSLVNKGFTIWSNDYIKIAGIRRAISRGQDRPILPAQVANQNTGFASSYLLEETAI